MGGWLRAVDRWVGGWVGGRTEVEIEAGGTWRVPLYHPFIRRQIFVFVACHRHEGFRPTGALSIQRKGLGGGWVGG